MTEEENIRLVREIGEVKAELSGLKAEVAGTNQRLDDIVITQLKDHGKRLAALERRQVWIGGWIAGAGAAGSALTYLIKFLGNL